MCNPRVALSFPFICLLSLLPQLGSAMKQEEAYTYCDNPATSKYCVNETCSNPNAYPCTGGLLKYNPSDSCKKDAVSCTYRGLASYTRCDKCDSDTSTEMGSIFLSVCNIRFCNKDCAKRLCTCIANYFPVIGEDKCFRCPTRLCGTNQWDSCGPYDYGKCNNCETCPNGPRIDCGVKSPGRCITCQEAFVQKNCGDGYYIDGCLNQINNLGDCKPCTCPLGQYKPGCGGVSAGQACTNCKTCEDGNNGIPKEYEVGGCYGTVDRICAPCDKCYSTDINGVSRLRPDLERIQCGGIFAGICIACTDEPVSDIVHNIYSPECKGGYFEGICSPSFTSLTAYGFNPPVCFDYINVPNYNRYRVGGVQQWVQYNAACMSLFEYDVQVQRTSGGEYNGVINQYSKVYTVCSCKGGYYVKTTGIEDDDLPLLKTSSRSIQYHNIAIQGLLGTIYRNYTYCAKCPAGTYSTTNGFGCIDCNPGTFSLQAASSCTLCPVGHFASTYGNYECFPCSEGWYQDEIGGFECKKCPEGYTSTEDRVGCRFCPLGRQYPFTNEECLSVCNDDCEYWNSINPNRNYQDEGVDLVQICTDNVENQTCFNCGNNCKHGRVENNQLVVDEIDPTCAKCSGALMLNGQDLCTDKIFSWKASDPSPTCYSCQSLPFELCDYDFRLKYGFTDDFVKFARYNCVPFSRNLIEIVPSYGQCVGCGDAFMNSCGLSQYIESCTPSGAVCKDCYDGVAVNALVFNNMTQYNSISDLWVLIKKQCQVMCKAGWTGYKNQPCDVACDVKLNCVAKDEIRVPCNAPLDGYCRKCLNREVDLSTVYQYKTFMQRVNFFDWEDARSSFEHLAVTEEDTEVCVRGSDGLGLDGPGMFSFRNGGFDKPRNCKWDNDYLTDQTPQSLQKIRDTMPMFPLENAFFDYGEWRLNAIAYGVKHIDPVMPDLGNTYLRVYVYDKASFTITRYYENYDRIITVTFVFWLRLEDATAFADYMGQTSFSGDLQICIDGGCILVPVDLKTYVWKRFVFNFQLSQLPTKHRFTLRFSTDELSDFKMGVDHFLAVYNHFLVLDNLFGEYIMTIDIKTLAGINAIYNTAIDYSNTFVSFYHLTAVFECQAGATPGETMRISVDITGSDSVVRRMTLCEKEVIEGQWLYTCGIHILKVWENQLMPLSPALLEGPIDVNSLVISPMQYSCQYACLDKNQYFKSDKCIDCNINCVLGQEFQGCSDDGVAICVTCPDAKPDNSAWIWGTCEYVCNAGYYMTPGGLCEACSQDLCEVGFYRSECRNITGDPCVNCGTLRGTDERYATNEVYVTSGNPFNQDNCITECSEGSFRDRRGDCVPCRTSSYRFWEVRLQQYQRTIGCTRVQDATYLPCGNGYDLVNGVYVGYGKAVDQDCEVQCDAGYQQSSTLASYAIQIYEDSDYRNGLVSGIRYYNKSICSKCERTDESNGYYTSGCNFVCNEGYRLFDSCVYCPAVVCPVGKFQSDCTGTCSSCNASGDPNKVFASPGSFGDPLSCLIECRPGYYDYFDASSESKYCVPCSSVSGCSSKQWFQNCTTEHDNSCLDCTESCGFGFYKVSNCSAYSDILCSVCPNALPDFSTFGEDCAIICAPDYVFTGSACVYCNLQQGCTPGYYPTQCVAENNFTGCSRCVSGLLDQSQSASVLYLGPGEFSKPFSCPWTCADGYSLRIGDNSTNFTTFCERQQTPAPQVDIQYSEFGICSPGTFATSTGCQACSNLKPVHALWTFRCNWACESGRLPRVNPVSYLVECITAAEFEVSVVGNPSIRSYVLNPYQSEYNKGDNRAGSKNGAMFYSFGLLTTALMLSFCAGGCFFIYRAALSSSSDNLRYTV
eukprot:763388-Hanusia_phi.AAC.6